MTQTELDTILNSIREIVHAEIAPLDQHQGKLESAVKSLDQRLARLEIQGVELKPDLIRRLDDIYDTIQEVMGDIDVQMDRKDAKLRSELEPRISQLEQLDPEGQHSSN